MLLIFMGSYLPGMSRCDRTENLIVADSKFCLATSPIHGWAPIMHLLGRGKSQTHGSKLAHISANWIM